MSRRSHRNANALAEMAAESLAIVHFSPKKHPQKHCHTHYEQSQCNIPEPASRIRTESAPSANNSPHSLQADDDDDADGPGDTEAGNGGDLDENDDEDSEDPAAVAPSGHAVGNQCDQAGLNKDSARAVPLTEMTHSARETRRIGLVCAASSQLRGDEEPQEDEDDEDYNAVDLISESDGEDPSIEQLEEENILNRISGDMGTKGDLGDLNIFNDGSLFPGDMPYFDEQMRRMEYSNLSADLELYKSTDIFDSFPSAPSPPPPTPTTASRRVHFDATAFRTPNSLTYEQESLFSSALFNDDNDSSTGSMSGYESDGETTDEDEVPVNTTKSPRALLRQPSWSLDFPFTRSPMFCSGGARGPPVKAQRPPRLGSWFVNPGKALGQSDASHNVVILEPKKPTIFRGIPGTCGGKMSSPSSVTGCLVAPVRSPVPDFGVQFFNVDQLDVPDPVLSTGTSAAMEDLLEGIIGDEGLFSQSQPPSTFIPATDVFDELGFATANSDHESTDLDIMNYMTFSDDTDDETAQEFAQATANMGDPLQGLEQTAEIHAPLMTPCPSQSQTTPSRMDDPLQDFHSSLIGSIRRSLPKAKSPAVQRRPHSGLALTRPATRANNRHISSAPAKFEKKRKLSDSFASSSKRPSLKTRVSSHQ
ncbi:MAG: hypothetical protein Q9163_004247 [Psora crenata]